MDVQSVAHTLGTCFAEFVRERVEDHGGHADEGKLLAQISRQYRIPAEYGSRMMGYAARAGAVEVKELADGGATVSSLGGYAETSSANTTADAFAAEDRGDYPVAYGLDTRRSTPAVLFPESTQDYVSGGPAETVDTEAAAISAEMFKRAAVEGRIIAALSRCARSSETVVSHARVFEMVFPKLAADTANNENINPNRESKLKQRYARAVAALHNGEMVNTVDDSGEAVASVGFGLTLTATSPGLAAIDRDEIGNWRKDYLKRQKKNAAIIEASTLPERIDYGADYLSADTRQKIETESRANTYYLTRAHHQQHGCINCLQADARQQWPETDRLINWLHQRGGKCQHIEVLYYERGAHTAAARRPIRAALHKLTKTGKARMIRRGSKVYIQLANSVKPRAYTVDDYRNTTSEDHDSGDDLQLQQDSGLSDIEREGEQPEAEQSFEPAVMAEMAASGASYKESWDS